MPDLAFPVDRRRDRATWRIPVEADDVLGLVDEVGIVRALECPRAIRLLLARHPDTLHRAQRKTGSPRHRPPRRVRRITRRLAAGQGYHLPHGRSRRRPLAGLARLVPQQPLGTGVGIALLPAPHRWTTDPGTPRQLGAIETFSREQDGPCSRCMFLLAVRIGCNRRQAQAIFGCDQAICCLCHAQGMAPVVPIWTLLNASVQWPASRCA